MFRPLCAAALLCATAAHALEARDFNADGTVDAFYDAAAGLTWDANPRPLMDFLGNDDFEVAGVRGWQLPTAEQLDSLVFGALGNTAESFQSLATLKTGPFADYYGFVVQEGAYAPFVPLGVPAEDGWLPVYLYDYNPAWLVIEGDVAIGAVSPAPEPSTWATLALGLAAVCARRYRRASSTSCLR